MGSLGLFYLGVGSLPLLTDPGWPSCLLSISVKVIGSLLVTYQPLPLQFQFAVIMHAGCVDWLRLAGMRCKA